MGRCVGRVLRSRDALGTDGLVRWCNSALGPFEPGTGRCRPNEIKINAGGTHRIADGVSRSSPSTGDRTPGHAGEFSAGSGAYRHWMATPNRFDPGGVPHGIIDGSDRSHIRSRTGTYK